jgi:hypothetical protein
MLSVAWRNIHILCYDDRSADGAASMRLYRMLHPVPKVGLSYVEVGFPPGTDCRLLFPAPGDSAVSVHITCLGIIPEKLVHYIETFQKNVKSVGWFCHDAGSVIEEVRHTMERLRVTVSDDVPVSDMSFGASKILIDMVYPRCSPSCNMLRVLRVVTRGLAAPQEAETGRFEELCYAIACAEKWNHAAWMHGHVGGEISTFRAGLYALSRKMSCIDILDRFTVHQVLENGHAFEIEALRSRPDVFRYAVPRDVVTTTDSGDTDAEQLMDVYFMVVQNTAVVPVLADAVREENKDRDGDYLVAMMVEGGRNVFILYSGVSQHGIQGTTCDAALFLGKLVFKRTYY